MIRVHRNGTATLVADLSDFVKTHPVKNPEEPVVPGSSSLFAASKRGGFAKLTSGFTAVLGLAVRNGKVYVLEMSNLLNGPAPGTGDIVTIDPFGHRDTVVSGLDFPTGVTFGRDGNLYVSNKGFGFGPGDGEILKVELQ